MGEGIFRNIDLSSDPFVLPTQSRLDRGPTVGVSIHWGLFGSPKMQDHSKLGSISGPSVFRNSQKDPK